MNAFHNEKTDLSAKIVCLEQVSFNICKQKSNKCLQKGDSWSVIFPSAHCDLMSNSWRMSYTPRQSLHSLLSSAAVPWLSMSNSIPSLQKNLPKDIIKTLKSEFHAPTPNCFKVCLYWVKARTLCFVQSLHCKQTSHPLWWASAMEQASRLKCRFHHCAAANNAP